MYLEKELLIFSPFEAPDVNVIKEAQKAGAVPVLQLGRDRAIAQRALNDLAALQEPFGICFAVGAPLQLELPKNINRVIAPYGQKVSCPDTVERLWQVHSLKEAASAIKKGVKALILKGNEGAGRVSDESAFILFQQVMNRYADCGVRLYLQGGMGIHSSAAALALGASGVVFDSQIALMSSCRLPKELRELLRVLSGNETAVIDRFRVLLRNNSPQLPEPPAFADLEPYLGGLDVAKNYIPMGQDIALAVDFQERYGDLRTLVSAFWQAVEGHAAQAKKLHPLSADNLLCNRLKIHYPIAQGPMARVSDVPRFADNVATAGALPFLAMSMASGEAAQQLLGDTKAMLGDKAWGVGILGFIQPQVREEQTRLIIAARPNAVLIAGGRPSIAKPFEEAGITTFLHVPSPALLDMFLKEKSHNFIFEGRESGGHIGPLSSLVLWEKQIGILLREDHPDRFNLLFAGGIHDALSAAFVSLMAAPLAAKGAGIGVLMGSAYIYTNEAVTSGAILPNYQKRAIVQNETVILSSALGQDTRALPSPFTDFFHDEKRRLTAEKTDSLEMRIYLEELNIGRGRVAAKGIDRVDGQLIEVPDEEQANKGLYMLGEIAALKNKALSIKELHEQVAVDGDALVAALPDINIVPPKAQPLDVAIIGMACILPQARNMEEYWRNILLAKDCVTEVPEGRWNKDVYYNPDTKDTDYIPSNWGGFIPTIDFDPLEFGMPPQSMASIEAAQSLSLLVAKQALLDAGYTDLDAADFSNTSVIFGTGGPADLAGAYSFRIGGKQIFGELPEKIKNAFPKLTEDSFAGVLQNVISGRIANRLNFGGRNFIVDAACASSLAALELACQELVSGHADLALAGGADQHNSIGDFAMFNSTHALSKKGYCASFDADSDGIAMGEGFAVVVLKRLDDALRDANRIYAVIKGVGGSSDGKSLGMTAPNRNGQIKAIRRAYQCAGISPAKIEMIEAHGTGTVVGDRTELKALTDVFTDAGATAGQTLLGSVKTQIGHTKCTAGLAGIIKTALAVYHGVQPPTIHLKKPNTYYNSRTNPFVFNMQPGIWGSHTRLAGVSAFGFGGTNYHAIIESYDSAPEFSAMRLWPSELFVFRGDTPDAANRLLQQTKALLEASNTLSIRDIAYSLAVYSDKPIQLSIVASTADELQQRLDEAIQGKTASGVFRRNVRDGKTAFLFSGQGSQRINMARELFVNFPWLRELLKGHPEYAKIMFPNMAFDEATRKAQQALITDTRNAQPTLGIVDLAIAQFLSYVGIEPDMVAGHSYGELPALCFAGVFAPDRLVPLSRSRADAILAATGKGTDNGKMLAVSLSATELTPLLAGVQDVWAVNFNSPKQTVLAGTSAGIATFAKQLSANGISSRELNVACAFHTPLLSDAPSLYAADLQDVKFSAPRIPVWSNTTAKPYPAAAKSIKNRMAEHLVKPVQFVSELENMFADGARIFIETGPGNVLTGLVNATLGKEVTAIESENKLTDSITGLLNAIAAYISTGKTVACERLFTGRGATRLDLDNPAEYRRKPTVWLLNGQGGVPANGKMPAHGAYPIVKPLMNLNAVGMSAPSGKSDAVMMEYLQTMRTLAQNQRDVMLGFLGHTPPPAYTSEAPAVQPPKTLVREVEETVAQVISSTENLTPERIKELLLDIVSEKTGYPVEMLGMDQDLEADLSIDSIKRMEIIGALRDRLNITGEMEETEDALEKIASIKTLNGLISWISELLSGDGVPADAPASAPAQLPEAPETPALPEATAAQAVFTAQGKPLTIPDTVTEMERLLYDFREKSAATCKQLSISGKKFAIADDGRYAPALKAALDAAGAEATIVSSDSDLTEYNGLVVVASPAAPRQFTVMDVFDMLKRCDMSRLAWALVLSDTPAHINAIDDVKKIQGFSGLTKTLLRDCNQRINKRRHGQEPTFHPRTALFYQPFDEKNLPQTVIDELTADDEGEIFYRDGKRCTLEYRTVPIDVTAPRTLELDNDAVVIAFGGAQGISPTLLRKIATEYPCRYIVVGRSQAPSDAWDKYKELESKEQIKKFLLTEEQMKSPAEIEKKAAKIFKINQVRVNLEKIRESGAEVLYESLDMRDEAALRAFIRRIYQTYGRIDGVYQAAAILEDKLFVHKTRESFMNVYSTKITPFHVLLEELHPDLKYWLIFSSGSSLFGSRGQSDYAAANSIFDIGAEFLKLKFSGRIVAVAWGPWEGAGMVSDLLAVEFRKRNIPLIPLEVGAEYLVNELKYGTACNTFAVAWPFLDQY